MHIFTVPLFTKASFALPLISRTRTSIYRVSIYRAFKYINPVMDPPDCRGGGGGGQHVQASSHLLSPGGHFQAKALQQKNQVKHFLHTKFAYLSDIHTTVKQCNRLCQQTASCNWLDVPSVFSNLIFISYKYRY